MQRKLRLRKLCRIKEMYPAIQMASIGVLRGEVSANTKKSPPMGRGMANIRKEKSIHWQSCDVCGCSRGIAHLVALTGEALF